MIVSAYRLVMRSGRCSIVPLQMASGRYVPSARDTSGGTMLYSPYRRPRKAVSLITGLFMSG